MPALLAHTGWDRVDLLKIDVEGAETSVLADAARWLGAVDCLAVELHDADATRAFEVAVSRAFEVSRYGELTVGTRQSAAVG